MDTKELEELAERCMRLAKAETNEDLAKNLIALSYEYLSRSLHEGPDTEAAPDRKQGD